MSLESGSPWPADTTPRARVYAAQLDAEPCAVCAAHAGLEYAPEHPHAPSIPNPACTRPEGCRCAWL